ncbi:hypothetical protein DMB92_02025 [Campylobacter sp. MIT 99-7217]|uniref:LTA synthase family protein n=1 Tax=Campylobacter sp. MIT 99-7217 TaxID=535091 RepID=UPI0011596285|nr:alkaline phosphatase family protein [Campylobacter sp. MIT 99-7217]TQR33687.1 hypothetical protein DMB92_02025 [Campylobacter sp. MIT 99-7217]
MKLSFKQILIHSFIFFIFLYFVFLSLRLVFILYIQGSIHLNVDFFTSFYNAFRYDGQIIGVLVLGYFLLSLFLKQKLVRIYAFLCIFITCFVNIANIGFYEIYKDVFNATLLGLIFDDQMAILKTGLSGEFNLSIKVLLWLILSFVFYALFLFLLFLAQKIFKARFINLSKLKNLALFLCLALCLLFAINGQIGLKGISLGKELVPVSDTFLRQITQGAYRDLNYVYKSYAQISKSSFQNYIDESPIKTASNFFNLKENDFKTLNLHDLLQKEVQSSKDTKIDHIFYIVAESFSAWHFDEEFKEMNLTSELSKMIDLQTAFCVPIFIQNAASTIKSLDVQISGLYQIEIPLNLSVGKSPVFNTSAGFIFKSLGYENNFYYGGSGTWQKLDSYTLSQGFDQIFYNTHVIDFAKKQGFKAPFENAWGAYDHYLYEFIKAKSLENAGKKTFSMIMTTSYHPPYDLPLEDFNVPFESIDQFLQKHDEIADKTRARKVFAHIYYQDKMLAKFIKETSKALPNSLFVITGDHYDREYPFKTDSAILQNQIPFILYAPNLKPKMTSKLGSHIDIVPTIVELVAPKGFKYESFGYPLFSNQALPKKDYVLGYFAVANERFLNNGYKNEYFEGEQSLQDDESLAEHLLRQLKRAKALSWWIFRNGYEIKDD